MVNVLTKIRWDEEWEAKQGDRAYKHPITGKWVTFADIERMREKADKNANRLRKHYRSLKNAN